MEIIEKNLCVKYFENVLFILHIAHGFNCGEISVDSHLFAKLISKISMQPKIVRSLYRNFPKATTTNSGRFQFLRALNLMQNLTGSNSPSEFQLVSAEHFRKALERDDSQFNGIVAASLSYLAALNFASSRYQQAVYVSA